MSLKWFAVVLGVLAVLGEAGPALWRWTRPPACHDPCFSFPPAAARFGDPDSLDPDMRRQNPDRGARVELPGPDHTRVSLIWMEWDADTEDPFVTIAEHYPEMCNVSAGFKFLGIDRPRTHQVPGQLPMVFDTTLFTDPAGHSVALFKLAWIQGFGSWDVREARDNRLLRIQRSFLRHRGPARLVHAGVYDARDPDHAWEVFRETVLEKLVWQ